MLFRSLTATAPDLGRGVSPHSRCSWPWTCGISSRPPLLTLDVGYLLTATAPTLNVGYLLTATVPDLGHAVSPHSRCSWPWMWGISSRQLLLIWMWGISSQPLFLTLDVGYLLSAARRSRTTQLPLATVTSKKSKYLGVSLAKCTENLYAKNYATVRKETKEHLKK